MADTKISAATSAGALTGAEEIPVNDGGNSAKTTASAIAALGTLMIHRPPAGSATADTSPIKLTSGAVNTTPENGALEYLNGVLYFVPAGAARGVVAVEYFNSIQADFTLAAAAGVQSCFPTASDVLTLQATTTYDFEGQYILNTGATTHTTAMAFALAGGASVTSVEYVADIHSAAVNTIATATSVHVSGVASKVLNATSTAVYTIIRFRGMWRHNAAGTVTPQIAFSANPTGTNLHKVGSFIRFIPRGSNTVSAIGPFA